MTLATESQLGPPIKPPKKTASDFDDEIRDLGERIVNLTLQQASELLAYLDSVHGIKVTLYW